MNLPGLGDLGKLYGLPAKLREIQAELARRTVDGAAGGGLVTAAASGTGEIRSVRIDPELLRGEDREMIADLVAAAANDALAKSREMAAAEMQKALGGLMPPGMAGLGGLPGLPQ